MNKHALKSLVSAMATLGFCSAVAPIQAYAPYSNKSYLRSEGRAKSSCSVSGMSKYSGTRCAEVPHKGLPIKPHVKSSGMLYQRVAANDVELTLAAGREANTTLYQTKKTRAISENQLHLQTNTGVRELIVVDEGVQDKHVFYPHIKPGVAWVEINSNEDGLQQLTQILAKYSELDALHLVSHASDGEVYLGSSTITQALLKQEVKTLAAINTALKKDADVLFYGCKLGSGDSGKKLLELIASEAQVDVAASTDNTGNANAGANWELEIQTGDIESDLPFSERALKDFSHVLAFSGTINFGTVTTSGTLGGNSAVNAQFGGAGGYTLVVDGVNSSTYGGFGRGYSSSGESLITLEFSGGETFTPTSLYIYNIAGAADAFTVTSDVGGSVSSGSVSDSSGATLDLSSFGSGVSKVYVAVQDSSGYFSVDNFTLSDLGAPVADSDGGLIPSTTVTEPVDITTTIDTVGEAIDVFDFTLTDGGGGDGQAMTVSQIVVQVGGSSSDAERGKITWRLNGSDASNVSGSYSANTITFSGLSISIADNTSETYTLNAYYNDNTSITDGNTYSFSVDGDTDVTVGGAGTGMGTTSAVTSGTGALAVYATALVFTTQPATSTSGTALGTQPVITARDAFGNTDTGFTETITVTEASAGVLSNNIVAAAVSGVATFSGLTYTATADQQSFTLTADDEGGVGSDIPTVNANAVTSDVVATQLVFDTQPVPLSVNSGVATSFTTVPIVSARDGNSVVDTGYSTDISLAEVNGAGAATMTGTGDTDGSPATVSIAPSSGVATFTGLQITYTASGGSSENFNLQGSSGGLSTVNSNQLTGLVSDSDGNVTAAAGVTEPVALSWSVDTVGEAMNLFDFTLSDGGGADGQPLTASSIVINITGTASDTDRAKITWRLNGPDVSHVTGVYNAGADTLTFSGLSVSVADGGSEIYTINGYYNDNSGLTQGQTVILSVDGDTDVTTGTGTQMGSTSAVTNGSGTVISDDIAPAVTSVSVPANATYSVGQNLDFTVNFDENVTVNATGGTPRLTLTIGGTSRYADFIFGSGSASLVFRHTVVSGDIDSNGIAVSGALDPNSGTLQDGAGNTASNTLNSVGSLAAVLVDADAPTVAEVTAVTTPGNDSTPNVTFSSTEAGALSVGGSCGSSDEGAVSSGNTTFTLTQPDNSTPLSAGTYSDCTVTITDAAGNASSAVMLSSFIVDLTAPTVAEVTAVVTPANDGTPNVTVSSTEAGTLVVGGSCGSGNEGAIGSGNTVITLTQPDNSSLLADGTYSDCTVTITDSAGNSNTPVTLTSFTVDSSAPSVAEVTVVATPANDATPNVTISSNEAGTLAVGGSCGSGDEGAISSGNTTLTLTQTDNSTVLAAGTYSDCTIIVTDAAGNANTPITLTSFTIDLTAPTVAEVTAVTTPGNDSTPNVTISTNEAGTLAVGGSCGSSAEGAIGAGNTTITLTQPDNSTALVAAAYSDCTITVTDSAGNSNTPITLTSFAIDITAPTVAEVTAVTTPGNDTTPNVTISTNEVGTLTVGGSCGSTSEGAISAGNTTITLTQPDNSTALVAAAYSDCTITVTDAAGNANTPITLTSFSVDLTAPSVAEVTAVITPGNDSTPDVTLSTNEAGTLAVGGSCGSSAEGAISAGNTTITLTQPDNSTALVAAAYSDCTITVTDAAGNANTPITLTSFSVDLTAPSVAEVTAVTTPDNDSTPDVTLSTNEAGTLAVGGSCGSSAEGAISAGNTTITLTQPDNSTALAAASYSDCTITVTDAAGNANTPITLSSFTIDVAAPSVAEVTAVSTPGNDSTPSVTISSNEAGTLAVGGSCGSASEGAISAGNTAITLTQPDNSTALAAGTYSDCTIIVTDAAGNANTPITLTSFSVDLTAPSVAEVTAVTTPDNDSTPDVTLSTNEAGTLAVGGSCGSSAEGAISAGNTTITLTQPDNSTALAAGTYSDCTITVTDAAGNANTPITLSSFTIDLAVPVLTEVSAVATPGNDSTPTITFSSSKAGMLAVGGSCGSGDEGAISSGNTTITLTQPDNSTALAEASYSDCSLTVTDSAGNISSVLTLTAFTIDVSAPTLAEVTAVTTPGNDTTPNLTLSSTEAGTLNVAGSCGSASEGAISSGNTTMALTQSDNASALADNTYTDCSATVTDAAGNASTTLTFSAFLVDSTSPAVATNTGLSLTEGDSGQVIAESVLVSTDAVSTAVAVTYTVATAPANGTLRLASTALGGADTFTQDDIANNRLSYDHDGGETTSDSFTFSVQDALGNVNNNGGSQFSFVLAITPDNDAPQTTADSAITDEDNAVNIAVLGNDADADDGINAASVTVTSAPTKGSTSVNTGTGVITYTPDDDTNGSDSFSYTVEDASGALSAATLVSITVNAINDAPVASNDLTTTDINTAILIDVAANDSDVDTGDAPDTSTLVIVSGPSHGSAIISAGQIDYTPTADYTGMDSFTYTIDDSEGTTSNTATVSVTVIDPNTAPVAVNDAGSTAEDNAVTIAVLDNDSDGDGSLEPSSVVVTSGPANGSVAVNTTNGAVTYTPSANFNGSDSFTYTVEDDLGALSSAATVTITVTAVNDAPVAANDSVSLMEDATLSINVLGNDSDIDGSLAVATITLVTDPASGVAVVDPSDGSIDYTPLDDYAGSDSFTYQISDNLGLASNVATVTLTVDPVNDPPLANNDSASVAPGASVIIDVFDNDSDIDGTLDAMAVTIVSSPTQGALTDNNDGSFTYTADASVDVTAGDRFTYTVADNVGDVSNVATVTLTFVPAAAPNISGTPAADVEEDGDYLFEPSVVSGDNNFDLSYSVNNLPDWLSFNSATGAISGHPGANDVGVYSNIQVSVFDGVNTVPLTAFAITVATKVDTDGDTITDYQEGKDDTDPNDPLDYLDLIPPNIEKPADIIVDAVALYTRVTVAQLLGLNAAAGAAAIDAAKALLVSDNVDGPGCCRLTPAGAEENTFRLAPGLHHVVWQAQDRMNNTAQVTQDVYIRPLVSLSRDSVSAEGATASIMFNLNGPSPFYPLHIPYVIDSASSATDADHDLVNGTVTFNEGELRVLLSLNIFQDDTQENDETLIVRIDDRTTNAEDLSDGFNADIYDINLGAKGNHQLTIVERNLPPHIAFDIEQNAKNTIFVTANDGAVLVSAQITDMNIGDTHTLDWSETNAALVDIDGDTANNTFEFNPATLSQGGVYRIVLTATDSAGDSDTESLNLVLVEDVTPFSENEDTDGDGIDDLTEGTADTDKDGIPDYLDNIAASNVLPEDANITDRYLMECDPGVRCGLGKLSMVSSGGGARLSENDRHRLQLPDDKRFRFDSDVFDFEVSDLQTPGQSIQIVIPLRKAIPANAYYRKLNQGVWMDFIEDGSNALHSSAGEEGFCPPPGDDQWQPGLNAGHLCLQLTIEDGGSNDADGIVNSSIADPGGIAVQNTQAVKTRGGGGSINMPFLFLLGLSLFFATKRTRLSLPYKQHKSRKNDRRRLSLILFVAVILVAVTQKSQGVEMPPLLKNSFVEVTLGQSNGDLSRSDFVKGMGHDGVEITSINYDSADKSYHVLVGYQFKPWLALTLGYLDLGEVSIGFQHLQVEDEDLKAALKKNYPSIGSGLTIGGRFQKAVIDEKTFLSLGVGMLIWNGDIDVDGAEAETDTGTDVAPWIALGVDRQLSNPISAGLTYQLNVLDNQNVSSLGVALRYAF